MNSMKMFFASLLFLFLVASCQKADDNGELGGFWKLMDIEYAASGDKVDCRENSYFMAVQLDLMQLRGNGSCYARFQHRGDSLFIQMIGADAGEKLFSLGNFGAYTETTLEAVDRKHVMVNIIEKNSKGEVKNEINFTFNPANGVASF